jgi:phosphoglycolate phosphatase
MERRKRIRGTPVCYFSEVLKLLVFDLDGTLADTREDLWASVNAALQRSGLPPLPLGTVMEQVGNGARNLIRGSLRHALAADAAGRGPGHADPDEALVAATLADFLEHYRENCLVRTRAYPGTAEALASLGGYRMAVLTNKPGEPARRILEGLGLAGRFDAIVGGDSPHGKKPDPAGLLHLIAALGSTPAATAMIGDGVQDARAARRAGAALLGYMDGIAPPEDMRAEAPDGEFSAMAELPGLVARLEARLGEGWKPVRVPVPDAEEARP